jgi:hypothetical protein
MKEQWRAALTPMRQPKYGWQLLARTKMKDGVCVTETLTLGRLPDRIVFVIGGLQSCVDASKTFAQSLDQQLGYPDKLRVGIFDYPNDGPLDESAGIFRGLLNSIAFSSPKTRVSIVAHSMGGLMARHALESTSPEIETVVSCVDQLIMICPPNQGSVLAHYADVLEFADAHSKLSDSKHSPIATVLSLIDDGLGEACDDLVPNSKFLCQLARCERVPGIEYCIFAGTNGPIDPLWRLAGGLLLSETRHAANLANPKLAVIDDSLKRASELIRSDELTRGLGDGAVSVRSARLGGVQDFVRLPMHHTEWCKVDRSHIQQLIKQVASRLAKL